jgi:acyl-CoA synthetase (AMP-forming)/AMP-acid ligase II
MMTVICSSLTEKERHGQERRKRYISRWKSGVIYNHPDVLEAAVIGVPDMKWGEALKAVIVLKPGVQLSGDALQQFCKDRLAAYKVPKSVDFCDSLPHTEVGKVNKVKLKEMIMAGLGN